MLLSIIVPVYNVAPYLPRCLDSILACGLADCEIILSLRASEDGSGDICRGFCERNPIVRLIEQDGKGLSNARNCAMRAAQGAYVLFIDSDDYVDSSTLDGLICGLRSGELDADVIATDFYRVEHPAGKIFPVFQIGEHTPLTRGMQFLPQMLRRRQAFWNVWRYIYRRSFLEANGISFAENLLSEDVDYTTSVLLSEPEILFAHSPFYFYNVGRGASLMDMVTLKRLRETVFVLSCSTERLRASSIPFAGEIAAQFQFEYILNMAIPAELPADERDEAFDLFRDSRQMLAGSTDPLVRAFAVFHRVLGTKCCAWLLHALKLLRRRIRRWTKRRNERK
ncbi:MAG: glycosyltransferase [Clostridiales bacterium]|nr:glycosyltransferase [Clostridiales bacterium]